MPITEFRRPNKKNRRAIPQATENVEFNYTKMDVVAKLGFDPTRQWEAEGWAKDEKKSTKDGSRTTMTMSPEKYNELRAKKQKKTDSRAGQKQRIGAAGHQEIEIKREIVNGATIRRSLEAKARNT